MAEIDVYTKSSTERVLEAELIETEETSVGRDSVVESEADGFRQMSNEQASQVDSEVNASRGAEVSTKVEVSRNMSKERASEAKTEVDVARPSKIEAEVGIDSKSLTERVLQNELSGAELDFFRKTILDTFNKHDTNGDGILSRDEVVSLLRFLDQSGELHYDGVDAMLAALDRNGDGLVDTEEFVEWVLQSNAGAALIDLEESLSSLRETHVFLSPQDEAFMERFTLFDVRKKQNSKLLADIGSGDLDDPGLLVMSVGSSSTQVYDACDFTASFHVGTKVSSKASVEELRVALAKRKVPYKRVLLLNAIGYLLELSDPCLVPLSELVLRKASMSSIVDLHAALVAALPKAAMHVFNRSKDPATKRYKYAQLVNDFSEALACGRGLHLCHHAETVAEEVQDAIVDWGGNSFKVYVNGKRIGTELMDANTFLCEGGVLDRERLAQSIRDIKGFVLRLLPNAERIFIAQTGKARELAIKQK